MFRAGAAEVVITPPIGTPLDGYGGRFGGAVGVHDDLYARAIVFDDGATQGAIVGCDLVGIDRRLAQAVREMVQDATGMPGGHIMVAATHTHAGPAGLRADMNAVLTDSTARLTAGAVIAAHRALRPAVLKAGRGDVDSVSQNRRDPDGQIGTELQVLLFDSPQPFEAPIASIVNFACHATVLFGTNMHISADYPGAVVRTVKRVLDDAPVVYLNGACGDVNPSWMEQNYDEVTRVGSIIGSEAARRLQELRPLGHRHRTWNIRWDELTERDVTSGVLVEAPRLRIASAKVDVPARTFDAPETYDGRIGALRAELSTVAGDDVDGRHRLMAQLTMLQGERGFAAQFHPRGALTLHPEVQAISFAPDVAVLGLPGEFFAETAEALRASAGVERLLIACYANHHVFYVVPKHAFADGGYEPGVALLDETAEETFRGAAVELLRSTRGEAGAS